jgi:hypothetical protein
LLANERALTGTIYREELIVIDVRVTGGDLGQEEIDAYVEMAKKNHPDKRISAMDIAVDGEFVDITYHWETVPFERIRRITGYLVGTLDRFNDGKRAEEADRVKHSVEECSCSMKAAG